MMFPKSGQVVLVGTTRLNYVTKRVITSSTTTRRRTTKTALFSSIRSRQKTTIIRQIHNKQEQNQQYQSKQSQQRVVVIPESIWRKDAIEHQRRTLELLQDGLVFCNEHDNKKNHNINNNNKKNNNNDHNTSSTPTTTMMRLDSKHPIYNFLIEYYGFKGTKGVNQLIRWSPSIYEYIPTNITTSATSTNNNNNSSTSNTITNDEYNTMINDIIHTDVVLAGATENDIGTILNLRGISAIDNKINNNTNNTNTSVTYNLYQYYSIGSKNKSTATTIKTLQWYKAILQQTLTAEPIFHCYGLHEWAMMYWPQYDNDNDNDDDKSNKPPSAKYQDHLPLRVSQNVINTIVEKKPIQCTHYDALRFFAPSARQYNKYGSIDTLQRHDQLTLEQPGCIHGQMDLLKIGFYLQPFNDCLLQHDILKLALNSRRLDIAASPYDTLTTYNIQPICIETIDGQRLYQQKQVQLFHQAQPIRNKLLSIINWHLQIINHIITTTTTTNSN